MSDEIVELPALHSKSVYLTGDGAAQAIKRGELRGAKPIQVRFPNGDAAWGIRLSYGSLATDSYGRFIPKQL